MRQAIVAKINIYDYINRYVPLQQKGKEQYLGLCPFHNEKTPSFSVNTEKQFFHCFGCKTSGDVVKFAMLHNNIDFEEVITQLASECGIEIDKKIPIDHNRQYILINTKFASLCNHILYESTTSEGLNYIKSRGIKDEMIKKYQLGYLPYSKVDWILVQLNGEFTQNVVINSGVFKKGLNEKIYSPFAGRIIFPIIDQYNKNVGFGSRIITEDKDKAKYLNSADSDFFHKSEILYGMKEVQIDAVKLYKTVFVVEGYMDVISMANYNIGNVVGGLGANLTLAQLKQLWKITDRPTICLDSDEAGKTAMARIAKMALSFIEPGKSISFLEIQKCKDPDEFIIKYGFKAFIEMAQTMKMSLADYIYHTQSQNLSLDDPDEIVSLRQKLENLCNEITNDALRNAYKSHFNKVFFNKKTYSNFSAQNNNRNHSNNVEAQSISQNKNKCNNIEQNEEDICNIINNDKNLLLDQKILDEFMRCKFTSNKANMMRLELTNNVHTNNSSVQVDKKTINGLLISLQIKNVQKEMLIIRKEAVKSREFEEKLIQLKKYEMQLQAMLASMLI